MIQAQSWHGCILLLAHVLQEERPRATKSASKEDGGRGGRPVAGHLKANCQQHDGSESYRGPCGESRREAGNHRQDDAEAPDGLSNFDNVGESARDASRSTRLRLNETSGPTQRHVGEGAFCGRTLGLGGGPHYENYRSYLETCEGL